MVLSLGLYLSCLTDMEYGSFLVESDLSPHANNPFQIPTYQEPLQTDQQSVSPTVSSEDDS